MNGPHDICPDGYVTLKHPVDKTRSLYAEVADI